MTLSDVLQNLDQFSREDTIYAVCPDGRWSLQAMAAVEPEPEDGDLTQVFAGVEMQYLLEVSLAREVVKTLQQYNGINRPSPSRKLQAIAYYVEHDVYLPREAQ